MNKIAGFATVTKTHLEAAWMAELIRTPHTPEAQAFVAEVLAMTLAYEAEHFPRDRSRRAKDARSLEQGLGALLADLILHTANTEAAGFMYRSSSRSDFSKTLCSSRAFDLLMTKLWPAMELIELKKGFQTWVDFDGAMIKGHGKARRFRATPLLLTLANKHEITPDNIREHFGTAHDRSHPVQVRGKKIRGRRAKSGQ